MAEIEVHLRNGHSEAHYRGTSDSKPVCDCCPYGYHIDLDFVRFCEKLAKASGEPSLSKKLRRERRRQRQSMEVLLGLTNPVIWNIEQLLPTIAQEASTPTETTIPTPIKYSSLTHSNDGLNKAVLDFEATLERTSKKKKQKNEDLDAFIHRRPTDFNGQILRDESPAFRSSQDMSPYSELDIMSMYHSGGGTSPGPLQNIREQMAISLKRMKELEEKVKIIPSLEIELDELKNEKFELIDKLEKLKSTLRHTEHHLNELKSNEKEKKFIQAKLFTVESKPVLRDIGVSCKVLTRDVGITPVALRNRTVSTETITDSLRTSLNGYTTPEITRPVFESIKSQSQPEIKNRSTLTDLCMKDISDILEKKTKNLSLKDVEAINLVPQSVYKLNKCIQASIKEPSTILKVIEKRETGVQVDTVVKKTREAGFTAKPKTIDAALDVQLRSREFPASDNKVLKVVEKRETGVQVDAVVKRTREAGFTAKPKTFDAALDVRPRTREFASSDDKITDVLCDKCKNLKTRSVGVGLGNVKLEEPIRDTSTLINRSKSFQLSESFKPKIMTRNVGVGTVVPIKKLTSTKGVGTHDFTLKSKHTGVNTLKISCVDAAVGSDRITDTVCDKCKNEAKPPLRPVHKDGGDSHSKEPQPSKIPRPKSNQTTPVMERKKFVRQDTYTKIPATSPFDAAKKTPKPKVKSTTEKLNSPIEEKVEVTLRKKTKAALAQSPGDTEKSLSKDLKDISLGSSGDRYSAHFDDYYFDYDENYDDDSKRNSALFPDNTLFQPIQDEPREKIKPSKEMKAAMKVVNDSLSKHPNGLPKQLKNASNIIQQEWFKVSSTASANPLDVEDYLDSFEEVSSILLEYIVNMVDNNGNTAMHYAVSHGNFDVVSILLDSKVCNINKMNAAGYTCIMLVSLAQVRSETHQQVVKRLFQLADVNIRAKQHGQTALMLAVSHGRLDMVKLLLEAGADPNIQDGDGSTALMCAAEHGHLEIVKHILAHPECDTSITDCDGSTALAIAMEAGNRDIGVLLYAREHFSSSRGSSPYTSLRGRKSKSSSSPHPRTPTSPNPNRKSDHSM